MTLSREHWLTVGFYQQPPVSLRDLNLLRDSLSPKSTMRWVFIRYDSVRTENGRSLLLMITFLAFTMVDQCFHEVMETSSGYSCLRKLMQRFMEITTTLDLALLIMHSLILQAVQLKLITSSTGLSHRMNFSIP